MTFTLPIVPELEVYRGTLEVADDDGNIGRGVGRIALVFQPRPELVWSMQWSGGIPELALGPDDSLPQRVNELRLTGGSVSRAMVLTIPHDGLGGICREVRIGTATEAVDEIEFFLPNFGFAAASREAAGGQYFTIETRQYQLKVGQPTNYKEILDHLRRTGGYAYTARGELRRRDGQKIPPEEAQKLCAPDGLLAKLGWFLSFANGGLTFPIEINGIADTFCSWRFFAPPRITPWSDRSVTWCNDRRPSQLDDYCKSFQRFRALLNNFPWNENVSLLIDWYLTVLEPAIIEQRIISTQTALELFAWNRLVQDRQSPNRLSPEEYEDVERYPFKRKLRMILEQMKVDHASPLWSRADGKKRTGGDAVDDFVDCRNHIIHPRPKAPGRGATQDDRFAVYLEGVRYLELVILYLMGYWGSYEDRRGLTEAAPSVPWAVPVEPT